MWTYIFVLFSGSFKWRNFHRFFMSVKMSFGKLVESYVIVFNTIMVARNRNIDPTSSSNEWNCAKCAKYDVWKLKWPFEQPAFEVVFYATLFLSRTSLLAEVRIIRSYLFNWNEMRCFLNDNVARTMPFWHSDFTSYSYIHIYILCLL